MPVLLLFDFSRLCRVILAGESLRDLPFPDHLQWSAANISSYYLFLIFLSHSLPRVGVFLTTFSFFLSSSFVFILTFKRGTQPSCQFRLVSYIVSPTREGGVSRAAERAAPSVFRIMISFFLSFRQSTRNHKGKFTLRHCECIAHHKG